MSKTLILLSPTLLLVLLLVIGVPVGYTMLISGTTGLVLVMGYGPAQGILMGAPRDPISFTFTTIPLFILMAEFLSKSGIIADLYDSTQKWLGHFPGGLAIATTIANGGMAALSGSSTASVAAMSKISYGEMQERGYRDDLTLGSIAGAGTFAVMIPPSLGLIVYGLITENNIGLLFLGGIVPGVLTLAGYIGIIMLWTAYDPKVAPTSEKAPLESRLSSTLTVWPGLLVIFGVLGGIYSGIITATEAGAVGAVSAFLVATAVYGMGVSDTYEALRDTLETSGMLFLIIFGALVFGFYLTVTQLPQRLVRYIDALPITALQVLLLLLVVYILLGALMDQLAILLLTLPITYPVVVDGLGFGPIWFGVLIAKTIEIGLVTPPIGLNVYIATGTVDADLLDGFKGAARFLLVDVVVLGLLIAFPQMVSWVH
jgi:tripartite ATP-independent transporter DctM subunit